MDYTNPQRCRRYRARKRGEDVPLRLAGRPRRGTEDSVYVEDQPLSVLAEWMVYQLDQLPNEKDPQKARDMFLFQRYIRSWGEAFARAEATARDRAREIR